MILVNETWKVNEATKVNEVTETTEVTELIKFSFLREVVPSTSQINDISWKTPIRASWRSKLAVWAHVTRIYAEHIFGAQANFPCEKREKQKTNQANNGYFIILNTFLFILNFFK